MAALWPTYIKNVGIFLDSPKEGKTEKQTAKKLAKEYKTAVTTAMTIAPAGINKPSKLPSTRNMINAIEMTLINIKDSEGKPKLSHFSDWATEVYNFWLKTKFSAIVPDPLHLAAATGVPGLVFPITNVVTNGGIVPGLQSDLLTAFSDGPQTIPYGVPMATKLAKAFTTHLTTVGGLHTMAMTGGTPISPIPIPSLPIPWIQLV